MSQKRKQSSDFSTSYNKRQRPITADSLDNEGTSTPYAIAARIDPTYGQRGAFPGLDASTGDEELFYGPASDGMEYLRMVRSEARGVPNLLVAPAQNGGAMSSNDDKDYEDDMRGYYEDGAYAALPVPDDPSGNGLEEEEDELDPQEAYYHSLLNRFHDLRALLHSDPPPLLAPPVPPTQSATGKASFLYTATHTQWRTSLLFSHPTPRLLSAMTQDCVLRGLARLETLLSSRNLLLDEGVTLGAWCWGLLGRCRDSGEMGSEEVAVVREVGKTALRVRKKIKRENQLGTDNRPEEEQYGDLVEDGLDMDLAAEEEVQDTTESVVGDFENTDSTEDITNGDGNRGNGIGTETGASGDLEEIEDGEISDDTGGQPDPLALAKESLLAQVRSPSPSSSGLPAEKSFDRVEKALAMLDMIVTVVGEFYGQRDLLDARDVWGE